MIVRIRRGGKAMFYRCIKWLAMALACFVSFADGVRGQDLAGTPTVVSADFEVESASHFGTNLEECEIEQCGFRGYGKNSSRYDWRDSLSLFLGYEGSKQPQDFGINAHFGGRSAVNFAAPLLEAEGIGFQFGTAINATANAVQVVERLEGSASRTQSFTTIGCFQRSRSGWRWAAVYDFLYEEYYDDFTLSQARGLVGYQLSEVNEVGVKTAIRTNDDNGDFNGSEVTLRAINQGSIYYRHTYPNLVQIGCWCGLAEGHSEANYALGDLADQDTAFVYGTDLFVPLNDYCAIFGEANFITPADTGTVDAYLGMELFCWGGAKESRNRQFAPVLPVAGNTSFSVDLLR